VNQTTAQDAPGSTITVSDDRRVAGVFTPRTIARAPEAVDAAGPVDAQNAPTGPWKTADGFPQASTASLVVWIRKKADVRHRPATGLRQLPSAAAVASGAPFANPSPAEIVVANRQK
jgi:hypothetical protein